MSAEDDIRAIADQAWIDSRIARIEQPYAAAEHRCVSPPMGCGRVMQPLNVAFRDRVSRDEYDINGMCQACQDLVFDSYITEEDIAEWEASRNFERCPDCGRYCPVEHIDVGIGVISGFDCCYNRPNVEHPPRCTKVEGCTFGQDHYHKCDNTEYLRRLSNRGESNG